MRGDVAFLLFILFLAIGVTVWWFVFRKKGEEGDTCTPEEDDEVENVATYELDEDLDCVPATCTTGYDLKDGECEYVEMSSDFNTLDVSFQQTSSLTPCSVSQRQALTDTNILNTELKDGSCIVNSCVYGWVPNTEKNACVFERAGQECDFPPAGILHGLYNSAGECIESACNIEDVTDKTHGDNAIYTGENCTFTKCKSGYGLNADENMCILNPNELIDEVYNKFISGPFSDLESDIQSTIEYTDELKNNYKERYDAIKEYLDNQIDKINAINIDSLSYDKKQTRIDIINLYENLPTWDSYSIYFLKILGYTQLEGQICSKSETNLGFPITSTNLIDCAYKCDEMNINRKQVYDDYENCIRKCSSGITGISCRALCQTGKVVSLLANPPCTSVNYKRNLVNNSLSCYASQNVVDFSNFIDVNQTPEKELGCVLNKDITKTYTSGCEFDNIVNISNVKIHYYRPYLDNPATWVMEKIKFDIFVNNENILCRDNWDKIIITLECMCIDEEGREYPVSLQRDFYGPTSLKSNENKLISCYFDISNRKLNDLMVDFPRNIASMTTNPSWQDKMNNYYYNLKIDVLNNAWNDNQYYVYRDTINNIQAGIPHTEIPASPKDCFMTDPSCVWPFSFFNLKRRKDAWIFFTENMFRPSSNGIDFKFIIKNTSDEEVWSTNFSYEKPLFDFSILQLTQFIILEPEYKLVVLFTSKELYSIKNLGQIPDENMLLVGFGTEDVLEGGTVDKTYDNIITKSVPLPYSRNLFGDENKYFI